MEIVFSRQFIVNKIGFEFEVTNKYEVIFYVINGMTKSGKIVGGTDMWGHEDAPTQLLDETNPFPVFKRVKELIKEFIYEKNPPYFYFTGVQEKRNRIYSKLSLRFQHDIPFRLSLNNSGQWLFVRDKYSQQQETN